jgi:hypothetical protein
MKEIMKMKNFNQKEETNVGQFMILGRTFDFNS